MKEIESFPPELKTRRKLLTGIGLLSFFPILQIILKKESGHFLCSSTREKGDHESFITGRAIGRSGCFENKTSKGENFQ